jgi:hypothetical protein
MSGEFLPPDPHAERSATAPPAGFAPPLAPPTPPSAGRANAALVAGTIGLALLGLTAGAFYLISLPVSVAAWILGVRAQRDGRDHADVAVLIGAVGTVLAVVSGVVWVLVIEL